MKSLGGHIERKTAVLAKDFSFKPPLTYFLQVNVQNEKGQLLAHPMAGGGSGDFANLKDVHGFIELPAQSSEFKAGQVYDYYSFRT